MTPGSQPHAVFGQMLAEAYRDCHQLLLGMVNELSEEQFRWRPRIGPQSIGWNLWHVARWDDFFADVLVSRTPSLSRLGTGAQIWKVQNVVEHWGLSSVALGAADAGTGLTDAEAVAIQLPEKKAVIEYVADAFSLLDGVVGELDDSLLSQIIPGPTLYPSQREPDTYGNNLIGWINHAYAHLGTMEGLKGMLGFRGSVGD